MTNSSNKQPMTNILSQIILNVGDLNRSLTFYCGVLDLEVRDKSVMEGCDIALLQAGGAKLMLIDHHDGDQGIVDSNSGVVINFEVRDLVSILSRVKNSGAPVLRNLERSAIGGASLVICDPDGNPVLLSQIAETVH